MSSLDLDRYAALSLVAAPWFDHRIPVRTYAAAADDLPDIAKAVYIAFDYTGTVVYVGSVARGRGGLRQRFAEHCRTRREARHWTHLWVIALRTDTPACYVRWVEGVVGRKLRPTGNRRLPVVA